MAYRSQYPSSPRDRSREQVSSASMRSFAQLKKKRAEKKAAAGRSPKQNSSRASLTPGSLPRNSMRRGSGMHTPTGSSGRAKNRQSVKSMSTEERKKLRSSIRKSIVKQKSEIEKGVDTFVDILQAMQENSKQEQETINELNERLSIVVALLTSLTSNVEKWKTGLDDMAKEFPMDSMGESQFKKLRPFHQKLIRYQEDFRTGHHSFFVSLAKVSREIQKKPAEAPKPPVAPPVPVVRQRAHGRGNSAYNGPADGSLSVRHLLGEIQQGTRLRKLNHDKIARERDAYLNKSLTVAESLYSALEEAMDARSASLLLNSDDEDEDDGFWDDK
mmetsp:Transcript_25412/g.28266  ORF Transcript_25412/g.28266 Transcript_25412/m.28266 type:complete len:330 (-) Transcript_25412:71-1060(-)